MIFRENSSDREQYYRGTYLLARVEGKKRVIYCLDPADGRFLLVSEYGFIPVVWDEDVEVLSRFPDAGYIKENDSFLYVCIKPGRYYKKAVCKANLEYVQEDGTSNVSEYSAQIIRKLYLENLGNTVRYDNAYYFKGYKVDLSKSIPKDVKRLMRNVT